MTYYSCYLPHWGQFIASKNNLDSMADYPNSNPLMIVDFLTSCVTRNLAYPGYGDMKTWCRFFDTIGFDVERLATKGKTVNEEGEEVSYSRALLIDEDEEAYLAYFYKIAS